MLRSFQTSTLRHSTDLAGLWTLTVGDRAYPAYVPGCWETIPGLERYRGTATYQRTFRGGGDLLFTFAGVSHTAKVWVDDVYLGMHEGAYTGFAFTAESLPEGGHTLRVEVDNSFNDRNALSIPNDYMTYGGISRACQLETIGNAWLSGLQLVPERILDQWYLHIRITAHSLRSAFRGTVRCEINGDSYPLGDVTVEAGSHTELSAHLLIPDATPYTLEAPILTNVRSVLTVDGKDVDDQIERTGFRTVETCGSKLLINGQPVKLLGFNRHEDHALFGCAIPPEAMIQDLQIIRDMGGNAVRTCHYPNDPYFLDLCDEMGILVWEESHARGLQEKQMLHPMFLSQSRQCIDEMISRDISHPSIFIWGLLNECASDSDLCRPMFEELIARIRALDESRPVTYATCRPGSQVFGEKKKPQPGFTDGDQCLHLCDVVSFNSYPGWYHDASCTAFLTNVRQWAQQHGGANKPYIVSEIGAGGIYGFRSRIGDKWSEERQAAILREQLAAIMDDPETCGVFIWQFADCRVSSECFYGRPRTMNNKGIVDEYRRPKLAYDVVKEIYSAQKRSKDYA